MAFCNPPVGVQCKGELWSTIPAIAFVTVVVVFSLRLSIPRFLSKILKSIQGPFLPALNLAQAREFEGQFVQKPPNANGSSLPETHNVDGIAPRWRTMLFSAVALIETVGWLIIAILNVIWVTRHPTHDNLFAALPFLTAVTWVYALLRILQRPPVAPPFDLFILGILHLFSGTVTLGGQLYKAWAYGAPMPSRGAIAAESGNLGLIVIFLAIIASLPFNIPGSEIDPAEIGTVYSPEDYTSLARWMTFSWVQPLINAGSKKTLSEDDVWEVSPTLKSRPTFFWYRHAQASGVFWKLVRANSLDLIINFVFTEVTVVLEFAGPFFLRRILAGLENQGSRSSLYLYAALAFIASLLKAEVGLQHLWYGRRAASRIGTQLSAAIYDKALRISDQSGVVSVTTSPEGKASKGKGQDADNGMKDDNKPGETKTSKKDKKSKTDAEEDKKDAKEDKLGADVGKIVNLMGIDSQKLQNLVSALPFLYTAPLQIIISCIYLYNILGVSAFAGFSSLVIAVPLSQWISQVTTRITEHTLAAKDSRMKLVNEMFGAVKFIKFFAWENQWTTRIMKARDEEIKWLKKSRNVNVTYVLLWTLVPNVVSVVSFFVYIYTGHKLSISTAFTALRLFDMLREPLVALPWSLVSLAQTKVSVQRLNEFFNEREVPEDVCTLTRQQRSEQELELENATFRWIASDELSTKEAKHDDGLQTSIEDHDEGHPTDDDAAATASTSTRTAVGLDRNKNKVFELKDISLQLARGKLTVVTGPTASGKTALLMATLGEMEMISGRASLPKNPTVVDEHGLTNSIAYAAQTPWLQQLSIKDNIVFGYPFDEDRYDTVVEACALRPDFDMLEDGDLTEIGSKGVSLSGGQKARVALARAVYAPTQYLILDDIFSAVDSHTARFLFDHLFKGPLVAHRTVLLVTHHIELVLPRTHYVVQLRDGRVEYQGTAEELQQISSLNLVGHDASLLSLYSKKEVQAETSEGDKHSSPDSNNPLTKSKQPRKLVEEEVRAEGSVKWSVYTTYMKATSYWTWVLVLLGILGAEMFVVFMRLWISIWGSAYRHSGEFIGVSFFRKASGRFMVTEQWPTIDIFAAHNLTAVRDISDAFPDANLHPYFYVSVYCGIGVSAALVAMCTEWVMFTGALRGGRILFKSLLASLRAATFRFYDTTPKGRILNRFTKDFETFDGMLPFMINDTANSLVAFLAAVITVIVVVPWFLPFSAIIAYFYFRLSLEYLETSRDLRRMESTSRSPILAGFSDLIDGIITVRAFSSEKQFLDGHYKRVDKMNKFWYFTWMLNRWLSFRFDLLGATGVFVSTLFVLSISISTGLAGLSMVSAMTFSASVYLTCRQYTELELCLNSVERVIEFLDVPKEPPAIIESKRVPAYWPSNSNSDLLLVVEDLEVKYAPELPSVLHGISFALKGKERVGLLGRTGCGKSTLAMSLLRFVDPVKGRIIIDGIDIATIGTHDLRSRVTFIAQDQALFLGTVRDNLDPFNEHSDAECWDALARVHLISGSRKNSRPPSVASSVDNGNTSSGSEAATQGDGDGKVNITLDTQVAAGGQNFSNGQRQLLAIARALLKQSGVVIFDEATSSIDKATDVNIQAAIREEFHSSLLLTIAHRLETIIDFDRLIVLDKGRIIELDTPFNLIHKEGGIFRDMCIQSGSFTELEAVARAHAKAVGQ